MNTDYETTNIIANKLISDNKVKIISRKADLITFLVDEKQTVKLSLDDTGEIDSIDCSCNESSCIHKIASIVYYFEKMDDLEITGQDVIDHIEDTKVKHLRAEKAKSEIVRFKKLLDLLIEKSFLESIIVKSNLEEKLIEYLYDIQAILLLTYLELDEDDQEEAFVYYLDVALNEEFVPTTIVMEMIPFFGNEESRYMYIKDYFLDEIEASLLFAEEAIFKMFLYRTMALNNKEEALHFLAQNLDNIDYYILYAKELETKAAINFIEDGLTIFSNDYHAMLRKVLLSLKTDYKL